MSRVVSKQASWLLIGYTSEQPIRSQVSKLTQLLTMTTTHKFPPQAFKSCLRALGYDLPMVEEPEPEFEAILNVVDPNRLGRSWMSDD